MTFASIFDFKFIVRNNWAMGPINRPIECFGNGGKKYLCTFNAEVGLFWKTKMVKTEYYKWINKYNRGLVFHGAVTRDTGL